MSNKKNTYKVVLIGDSGVGKTNMVSRLNSDEFSDDFLATIGVEFLTKVIELEDNTQVKAQIWDTAGQERYSAVMSNYYRNAMGAIIVYDITRRDTFESIEYWYNEFRQNAREDAVVMLVGNKSDLESTRKVSKSEGEELAKKYNMLFEECSAKNGSNIYMVFYVTIKCIHERRKKDEVNDIESKGIRLEDQTKNEKKVENSCCF